LPRVTVGCSFHIVNKVTSVVPVIIGECRCEEGKLVRFR
jgi:hypothetical protein